ncbi:MAG TPA: flagellar biosynthetic protein FliO [Candidatus Angelobacter sp.]|nr:flagellar biosynthetic protein FliO [Candidatus Angelobacter sp.]
MTSAWVYAIAALAAAATIYGAIRFFGQRVACASEDPEEGHLEVLSRTPIGLGGSLVLVRFEGRRILLGVTRGQWTALADLGRAPSGSNPETGSVIDAELNRALQADRLRRGRKGS